jgi:hypothetical protein
MEFQEAMFDRFTRVVEEEAGQEGGGLHERQPPASRLIGEIFVLEETGLLADEDHGTADSMSSRPGGGEGPPKRTGRRARAQAVAARRWGRQ